MKYLLILGHPNPASFSSSLAKELETHLVANGDEVKLRNLYEIGFDPVLSSGDFSKFAAGQTPADVKTEQEYIQWAEHLVFIFPVWWGGMPAILKGYVDRVFSEGFAYRYTETGSEGLLFPRKGSTICASGEAYETNGKMHQAMDLIFGSTIFGFSGIEPCKSLLYKEVPCVSHEVRVSYIENAKKEFSN